MMMTMPTTAMEIILDLPPLHFLVRLEALRESYRLYTNSELRAQREGHSVTLKRHSMSADKTKKIYHYSKPFDVVIPSKEDCSENWTKSMMNGAVIFTDGCKTSEATGYEI